ncbi:MAG: glycosyltransferase family 4 protein [Micromonosporaceae bacterium]
MRVAIVTESFPPDVNGVAHSVVRVAEHLLRRGHTPLVVAPDPGRRLDTERHDAELPYPVLRVPSVAMPGYNTFRIGLPSRRLEYALTAYGIEVVHLASPFALGAWGVTVAVRLGLPIVAVYQTDVPGFADSYKLGVGRGAAWRWIRRIHNAADRTLAPSTEASASLGAHGVERVHLWRRGVDVRRFDPAKRDAGWRRRLAPDGEVIVGYVGRLAGEKRLELLEPVTRLPGVKVVLVGDGPARDAVQRALPRAEFLGQRTGEELARLYASFDVFTHTGPYETFCQCVQEALASGLPVVAPAAGGPLDLVSPGRNGFLVPVDDAGAVRDAVATLVASPELRRAYGRTARRSVANRTWEAVGDQLLAHYTAVIAERSARTTDGIAA